MGPWERSPHDGSVGTQPYDAVVVGAGLAGLWAVLHLPEEWDVAVVDAAGGDGGSSPWAQGGMAVAAGPDDSPELHAADTLRAGAGACNAAAVEVLAAEAPSALEDLLEVGCRFDRSPDGALHLNHEGGQSVRRSVHAADATGREIMRAVRERARDRATRVEGTARRLLLGRGCCAGVEVETADGPLALRGRTTLLATGGLGALYAATTNPSTANGDGAALAHLAGAEVADLEFVQFHPTVLAVGGHRRVLLTEALRGEGARVVDAEGRAFLKDVHPDGDLAPRDLVARAIVERGIAYLDASRVEGVGDRFPNVNTAVRNAGFDLTSAPVPIVPAAHYALGGAATDTSGRTSIPGLYAAGECAATGVHGANRMAGNSLTEAVVFGRRTALAMSREAEDAPEPEGAAEGTLATEDPDGWARLRAAMSEGAGLVRTEESLTDVEELATELAGSTLDAGLRLAAMAATLVCRAARLRRESRGAHFRADAPEPDPAWEGVHLRTARGSFRERSGGG